MLKPYSRCFYNAPKYRCYEFACPPEAGVLDVTGSISEEQNSTRKRVGLRVYFNSFIFK